MAKEVRTLEPGDDVVLTTISGQALKPVERRCVVCDYFQSEMSEYDANYVFVPLEYLQRLRTMEDRATSIQIRLKDYRRPKVVKERLQAVLGASSQSRVQTWEDKQGPLLAAISIEKGILNVLLFLIIAVAGFGILAIFSMIVVEKTRDIGILKALGASNIGVLKSSSATACCSAWSARRSARLIGVVDHDLHQRDRAVPDQMTGQEIFDRKVYYFNEIPTDIQPSERGPRQHRRRRHRGAVQRAAGAAGRAAASGAGAAIRVITN